MELIPQSLPFSFNYTAYDFDSGLFVGFSLYDVTTGTPIFIQNVTGVYSLNGAYVGTFTSVIGKIYLVIGAVYTDGTYATVDTTRGPSCEVYQAASGAITEVGFAYGTFDQVNNLYMQASVYDITTGAPVFVQTAAMTYVTLGVYYGHFTGTLGEAYQIIQASYTDGTYATVDMNRSPSSDDFIAFSFSNFVNVFSEAILTGQSLAGILTESE